MLEPQANLGIFNKMEVLTLLEHLSKTVFLVYLKSLAEIYFLT